MSDHIMKIEDDLKNLRQAEEDVRSCEQFLTSTKDRHLPYWRGDVVFHEKNGVQDRKCTISMDLIHTAVKQHIETQQKLVTSLREKYSKA